jgi:hypothetical protein
MNPKYLGDSYDVVKRFFCEVARVSGYAVYVDPMFTGAWTSQQRASFFRFLGTREVSSPTPQGPAALLIDPDTGIRSRPGSGHTTFNAIASRCDEFALVFVFDQSFSYGSDARRAMIAKLTSLRALGIRGIYYNSHARFLVCGRGSARVMQFQKALVQAGLPLSRFVGIPASAA